ncbi:hypothetical protein PVL29_008984 [Vitis rotundifolia]|uniref:Uncharacterized protein n=1 Tax=Vitis rotundifolia TaxID=103349 RepID=A0AA38ZY82_VITRO|nr:hypothetical protein PVL29_008984 [Vitis rotundifolia]
MKMAIAALDVLHSYPATPRMKNLVPYCRLSLYMEGNNSLAFSGWIDSIQYCHFQVISGIVSMATCTKRFCNKITFFLHMHLFPYCFTIIFIFIFNSLHSFCEGGNWKVCHWELDKI